MVLSSSTTLLGIDTSLPLATKNSSIYTHTSSAFLSPYSTKWFISPISRLTSNANIKQPSSKSTSKALGATAFESRVTAAHAYLLSTLTAHTLKDLEKSLPAAVPGISSMNAKDHVQALLDENLIHVEKIGTGNWYWCFGSDTGKQRLQARQAISSEAESLRTRLHTLQAEIEHEEQLHGPESETDIAQRKAYNEAIANEKSAVEALKTQLNPYMQDSGALQTKREEIHRLRATTEIWTENCYVLEGWMRDLGLPRADVLDVLRCCYGDEFVEDEGGLVDVCDAV